MSFCSFEHATPIAALSASDAVLVLPSHSEYMESEAPFLTCITTTAAVPSFLPDPSVYASLQP